MLQRDGSHHLLQSDDDLSRVLSPDVESCSLPRGSPVSPSAASSLGSDWPTALPLAHPDSTFPPGPETESSYLRPFAFASHTVPKTP